MNDVRIAKLTVGIDSSDIKYNRPEDLGTDKGRGAVLEDGSVVRGVGTRYVSKDAEKRHRYLIQLQQQVRLAFAMRFLRAALDAPSFFNIPEKGAGKKWVEETELEFETGTKKDKTYKKERMKVNEIPGLTVTVTEYYLGQDETADEKTKREWGERVADQLSRIPLGRGKELKEDSLKAMEALIDSPFIQKESQEELLRMVNELRLGTVDRQTFKRNIELANIQMDDTPMLAPRSRPAAPEAVTSDAE